MIMLIYDFFSKAKFYSDKIPFQSYAMLNIKAFRTLSQMAWCKSGISSRYLVPAVLLVSSTSINSSTCSNPSSPSTFVSHSSGFNPSISCTPGNPSTSSTSVSPVHPVPMRASGHPALCFYCFKHILLVVIISLLWWEINSSKYIWTCMIFLVKWEKKWRSR